jgi:2-dehydropantoate 2-reductase
MKRTKAMGDFETSTLVDYLAGRPLEIERIWGEPLRRAESLGVAAPRLEALYRQLVSLDRAARK